MKYKFSQLINQILVKYVNFSNKRSIQRSSAYKRGGAFFNVDTGGAALIRGRRLLEEIL